MKYVIVGGLSLDSVINADGVRMLDQFGGNAAYGCAGARIWAPGEVGMVARRGSDFPTAWLRQAEEAGIDTTGVTAVQKAHGLLGGLVYDDRGDRDNYVSREDVEKISGRGNNADMSPLTLHEAQVEFGADASDIPAAYDDAEAVHLAPRYLNKQLSCARHYRERSPDARIILDPMHFYMYLERSDELRILFSLVDVLLPSEAEVNQLFGPIAPEDGARHLADMGARVVVVKLGKDGCLVFDRDSGRIVRIPIFPV
ncbi:MAG: carbohydrate kinase family protein, partial [Planctomycetes bacterium]|nr:carbohydrate kinase family protein [Planctomycetota bacterium]